MANIFEISQLNPLKLYQQSDILNTGAYTQASYLSFNPNINDKGIDSDFYYKCLKSYMDKDRYWQPFQQGDVIRLQFLGDEDYTGPTVVAYVARLINCNGEVVKQVDLTEGSAVGSLYIRELEMPLYDVLEGKYFVQIHKVGIFTDYDFWVISEGIHVKQYHANTMLFKYSNTYNTQGIFFETGIEFQFRIHSCFAELATGSKFNVYEDQPLNLTLLSGVSYREWVIQFGIGNKPFPNWVLDKLERISINDTLYIENVLYTRSEGSKLEQISIDKNPLMQATLNVRPKVNDFDLYVSQYPQIILGSVPPNDWFYVTILSQTTPATSYAIGLAFNGGKNFVDYLNSVDPLNIVDYNNTYFAINDNNQIVLLTNNSVKYGIYSPGLTFTAYIGYLILDVRAVTGQTDLVVDYTGVASVNYAYVWGDGTKDVGTANSASETKVYTAGNKYTAYLFWDRIENLVLTSSDEVIYSIGGKLPLDCISFEVNSQPLQRITNNIFSYTNGNLSAIYLNTNKIRQNNINEIILYIYDANIQGAFDNPCTIDLSGQTPSAPPTTDAGLAYMGSVLVSDGIAITTD